MDITLTDYQGALAMTSGQQRHLLLGNGFSMAARGRFGFQSLYEEAGFSSDIAAVFEQLKTKDFEIVLKYLDERAASTEISSEKDIFLSQRDTIKKSLIHAVTAVHPHSASEIKPEEYISCARFLEPFIGKRQRYTGRVFSTNYDMLLYWTLVHAHFMRVVRLFGRDGFIKNPWEKIEANNSEVFYLRGGLHLYGQGGRTYRMNYSTDAGLGRRIGVKLIEQIRNNLDNGLYPVFVSEGNSTQKEERISSSLYLSTAMRKFRNSCIQTDSALFIVGHGLGHQDQHIVSAIGDGAVRSVFVGVYGGVDNKNEHSHIQSVAEAWGRQRTTKELPPPSIYLFDSSRCAIWRGDAGLGAFGYSAG